MKQISRTRHWLTLSLALIAPIWSGPAASENRDNPRPEASPQIQSAPFGLGWGMTDRELIAEGFIPANPRASGNTRFFLSESAPLHWPEAKAYMGITQDDQLAQVVAFSRAYTQDPSGTQGKAAYHSMKRLLIRQHGRPTSDTELSDWNPDTQSFYACLAKPACGLYHSQFEAGNQVIQLYLTAERGTQNDHQGSLIVSYEDTRNSGTITLP